MNDKSNPIDSYIPTPDKIDEEGVLVEWSLGHEKKNNKPHLVGLLTDSEQRDTPVASVSFETQNHYRRLCDMCARIDANITSRQVY